MDPTHFHNPYSVRQNLSTFSASTFTARVLLKPVKKRCGLRNYNLHLVVAALVLMPHPPAKLKLLRNFDAISKNVKICEIGLIEPKL